MPQPSSQNAALDFLRDWEEGKATALEEYITGCAGDRRELLEFVADCVVFDALACSIPHWTSPAR